MYRARGFNLPELMVSLTLGLLLLAAFMQILGRSRGEFTAHESLARLQDDARQAMSILVPDVEHAGFFGFTAAPISRLVREGGEIADANALAQPDAARAVPPAGGLPDGAHACGINLAVDPGPPVQATNNHYRAGIDATDCDPTGSAGGARAGADTLIVRHASLTRSEPRAGRVQIHARRFESLGGVTAFADGRAPGPVDEHHEIRDVEVHIYYIANRSVGQPGLPALRVKSLTESGGAAQFRDEELVSGVEDLQVELGIVDRDDPLSRVYFVAPGPGLSSDRRVVAVRLWLRLRAETTERGFADPRPLAYADVRFVPDTREATQRRLLVMRTVALRNAAPP